MKFSEKWLREWANPKVSTAELAEQLSMAGLEVDSVAPAANAFTQVVVGEILEAKQHPNADRLRCCKVNVGNKTLDIVCGAANARAGIKVAVALVGAKLSENFKIKKSKLRGEPSEGMICSSSELGLADASEGILELSADAPLGQDLRDYWQLDDTIIDIELTPNRGDCLSIKGVAREVSAINKVEMTPIEINSISPSIKDNFKINVKVEEECPTYCGRVISSINNQASSPLWLQERLRRGGIRSINPVVDVGNYVMLELGQPLHAFDLQKLDGGIQVRHSKAGEKITLLDAQEIELKKNTLIIADHQAPQAIAGVMGAESSAVSETTSSIFLESAFFSPVKIALQARGYRLQTDASYRFERGVDYQLPLKALERATELLLAIVGGQAGPVSEHIAEKYLPQRNAIAIQRSDISRSLGIELDDDVVLAILQQLQFTVISQEQGWLVNVPSYRFDIEQAADIVEEVARLYGYSNIPSQAAHAVLNIPPCSESQLNEADFCSVLTARGYRESITYSFVDKALQQLLHPKHEDLKLTNPLAEEMSVMRASLWPGLLQAACFNLKRQCTTLRLFETGLTFPRIGKQWQQSAKLGGLIAGEAHPQQWALTSRPVDFYDVKSDIEALLRRAKQNTLCEWQRTEHPALHPGQSASIYLGGEQLGVVGALHPRIAKQLGIKVPLYLFELDFEELRNTELSEFQSISKFPMIRRDLSFIVPKSLLVQEMCKKIRELGGKLLNNVQIFDIYLGQGIEVGQKSVAMGLIFRDPSRTLTEAEINAIVQTIVDGLKKELNAILRV